MAERRMFTQKIIDSDAFTDMPLSAQALYIHLNMKADDDGFVNNPKKIQRMIGASDDDLRLLILKRFILVFENGVIVIKHWRMHNLLRKDRYSPTQYQDYKDRLVIKENGAYTEAGNQLATTWQPDGNQLATQDSKGKDRLGKDSVGESRETRHKHGTYENVLLTDDEYQKLKDRFPDADERIDYFSERIMAKGYTYKSHYAAILSWAKKDEQDAKKNSDGMMKHGYDYDALFGSAG